MKSYPVQNIRNVCLAGHGGSGKTSFVESALFLTKAVDRLGKVSDGNTVSDFDSEEIKRQISISASLIPVEWKNNKLNIIDTPGYFDFEGEVVEGLRAADICLIALSCKAGITVGTEKAWKAAANLGLPRAFLITKNDEESIEFFPLIDALREKYGVSVCPLTAPIIQGNELIGFADIINKKAFKYDPSGKATEIAMPDFIKDDISKAADMINEAIAETSEELMEKYFAGEQFTPEELSSGLQNGILQGAITPVVACSAYKMGGIDQVLDTMLLFPSPDKIEVKAAKPDKTEVAVKADPAAPASVFVFKTVADPFVGKLSYFRVVSGTLKSDSALVNMSSGQTEKLGHLYFVRGKKQVETPEIGPGDIGAVTKLVSTNTGDTLCTQSSPVIFPPLSFPKPCLTFAVVPKAKGDEEKISAGLQKLMEEDPTFKFTVNNETRQQLISGLGDIHLDVIVSKLKNKFGTTVELVEPLVPYRETIRKKVKAEGKHKKQSGGHGQYGHVWIEFEPGEKEELTFEEQVFGGAVPKNYFPAVEKGLNECIQKGVLAGYPVVNLKATLVDGSYHPVDSSEMAFKMAGILAFQNAAANAQPVILEPMLSVEVIVPEEYMGDIIGDLNGKRGRILGMEPIEGGKQRIRAIVPQAEMLRYAIDLRSIARGRGSFTTELSHYEQVPAHTAQQIIEQRKKEKEES